MSGGRSVRLLVAAGLLSSACGGLAPLDPAELQRVPRPSLARAEPQVRRQIEGLLHELERALDAGQPRADLARAYGDLGQVLLAYRFNQAAAVSLANAARLAPREFRWRYYAGVAAQFEGRLQGAQTALEHAVQIRPDDLAALIRLGQVEFDLGRSASARGRFRRVLRLDAGSPAANYGLGRVALNDGSAERAVERFGAALDRQPEATAIHHPLGLAYRKLGDTQAAERHLAARGPTQLRFPDPLLVELTSLIVAPKIHLAAGGRAAASLRYDEAVAHYRRAVELAPDDATAETRLGVALGSTGAHEEATRHLRKAVELEPGLAEAHFNLGTALVRTGLTAEAIEQFSEVLAIDPADRLARLRRGLLYRAVGTPGEAKSDFTILLETDPDDAEARYALAGIESALGRNRSAAAHYRELVRVRPRMGVAYLGGAMSLAKAGRFEASRALLERGIEAVPAYTTLSDRLARLLATCPDDALRDGERAVVLARTNYDRDATIDHTETLAMALAEIADFSAAIRLQQELIVEAQKAKLSEPALARLRRNLSGYRNARPVRGQQPSPPE